MKIRLFVAAFAAAVFLCGCGYNPSMPTSVYGSDSLISTHETSSSTTSSASSSTSVSSSSTESSASSQTSSSEEVSTTSHDYSEIPYIKLSFTEDERKFAEQSLFIGDSICRGLEAFNVLSANNVLGVGNAGARNIFEMEFFRRGKDVDFMTVIQEEKPRHVVFWMGMNDVNMTDAQTFCRNYQKAIDKVLELPETDVIVVSITPICTDFTPHSRIVEFNTALSDYISKTYPERVRFVNVHDALQNESGELFWYYSSGDGVHINEIAYYQMLHAFFAQVDLSKVNEPVQSSSSSEESSSSETNSSTEETSSSEENSSSQSSQSSQTTAAESTSAAV